MDNLKKKVQGCVKACFLPLAALVALFGMQSTASAALPTFYDTEIANVQAVVADFGAAAAALFAVVIASVGAYQLLKSLGHFVIRWWASIARKMG